MKDKYYVYRFKDENDVIIYVGRTINLSNRFNQHEHLTERVDKIEYISCSSEAEMMWKEIYYINLYYNELSENISDVYPGKMKDIGLKDKWTLYTKFHNKYSEEQILKMYEDYIIHPPKLDYKSLIEIYNYHKMNEVGNDKYALTEKWYKNNTEGCQRVKNNLINYFCNILKNVDSSQYSWVCYHSIYDKVKGNGYTKSYFRRPGNDQSKKTHLAYLENNYVNQNYTALTSDQYALTCLLHFILQSGIREGKHIMIYIPSQRMRNLLKEWIETQEYVN